MAEPDIDGWLGRVQQVLDVPVEQALLEETRNDLLGLTREIAQGVERQAVPLTSYLIGLAVARGADPKDALSRVRGLLAGS